MLCGCWAPRLRQTAFPQLNKEKELKISSWPGKRKIAGDNFFANYTYPILSSGEGVKPIVRRRFFCCSRARLCENQLRQTDHLPGPLRLCWGRKSTAKKGSRERLQPKLNLLSQARISVFDKMSLIAPVTYVVSYPFLRHFINEQPITNATPHLSMLCMSSPPPNGYCTSEYVRITYIHILLHELP